MVNVRLTTLLHDFDVDVGNQGGAFRLDQLESFLAERDDHGMSPRQIERLRALNKGERVTLLLESSGNMSVVLP